MTNRSKAAVLLVVSAGVFASAAHAQAPRSAQTDSRWYAWLGCWTGEADTTARVQAGTSANATCIVPVAGSSAVEALTIARGKIVARDRLDASGPPHAINSQGCQGTESVNWSPTGRRVYLRADYTCAGGNKGASATIYAMAPGGDWLRVEEVRSGGGSVVSTNRQHSTATLAAVPAEAAHAIAEQWMSITTARAAAAAPIATDEIADAVHGLNASVVRSWLLAANQRFNLDGQQISALTRADVPQSVLQAIMASDARAQVAPAPNLRHDTDEYLNRRVYDPSYAAGGVAPASAYPAVTTMYVCPPSGCYTPAPYTGYSTYSTGVAYPTYTPYVPYPVIYSRDVFGGGGGGGRGQGWGQNHQPAPSPPKPGPVGRRP